MKKYLKTPEEVITALKDGKEVKDNNGWTYKSVDGFLVKHSKEFSLLWLLNPVITQEDKIYIEESEPLNVELGKFYKMRDGKKAMVGFVGPRSILVVCQEDGDTVWLNKNGKSNVGERPWEIIGEWED